MRTMKMKWHGLGCIVADGDYCAACGKTLKPTTQKYVVHVIGGGGSVLHPEDEGLYTSHGDDMGFHSVGPECRKQFGEFAVKERSAK